MSVAATMAMAMAAEGMSREMRKKWREGWGRLAKVRGCRGSKGWLHSGQRGVCRGGLLVSGARLWLGSGFAWSGLAVAERSYRHFRQ